MIELDVSEPAGDEHRAQLDVCYVNDGVAIDGKDQAGVAVGDDGVVPGQVVEVGKVGDEERIDAGLGHERAHPGDAGLELGLREGEL